METGKQKTLTVTAWVWCEDAAHYLADTLRGVPCYTVEDYRREIEAGGDTSLLRVATDAGATVGYVVVRVERYAGGSEGVILAASGRLAGAVLYDQLLPVIERMFYGVRSLRIDNCRPGAQDKLRRAGYVATHVVMRKPAPEPGRSARAREQALQALAAIDAPLGGGHLCAGPGMRPHKGGTSASTTQQTTTSTDRRMVVDSGSVGVSSDSSTVNVSMLDGGAIYGAQQVANNAITANYLQSQAALDAMRQANALVGEVNAQTGRTIGDVLQFGTDAFSNATDLATRANSDALQFASGANSDALNLVRMNTSDVLQQGRDVTGAALDTVRMSNSDALQFADNAQTRAADQTWRAFTDTLAYSQNVFDAGLSILDKARQGVADNAQLVATAYDNAKGEGTQKSYIAAAALAVVALGAISIMGKK